MADSLAVLRSSPKILNLALLVMSYGVSHRLFEFAWKGQLGVLYPSAQQYQVRRADFSGVSTLDSMPLPDRWFTVRHVSAARATLCNFLLSSSGRMVI